MANIKELEKYLDYEFSTGSYTGEDYISFQTKYVNYLRGLCKASGWELVRVLRNHYCFSAFIKSKYKFIYLSISDVRYFKNRWYNQILIRTAAGDRDYIGDWNNYASLHGLQSGIAKLFKEAV